MMRNLLYLIFFVSSIAQAALPLSFTRSPNVTDMALGQVQVLNYTIRNNLKSITLPIQSIYLANDGDQEPNTIGRITTTCPANLAPQASCAIKVTLNNVIPGRVNRHLTIAYGGRAPLNAPIKFVMNAQAAYTILVYIVGADLESKYNSATFNINQMEQVGSNGNISIVIETGGANKNGWRTVQRKLILNHDEYLIDDLGEMNMALQTTIESFFDWGIRNFPAKKYIAIFWNHGGGPNGGYGGDELFDDDSTPINELKAAMRTVTQSTGRNFEIIGFDACFLGNIETFAGLYPYTNYLMGSEDLEPGKGWQYNTFLNYISTHPTSNGLSIGQNIIDGYTSQNAGDSTTLSLIAAPAVPPLLDSITQFSSALAPYVNSSIANWKQVARTRLRTPDYSTSVWDQQSRNLADLLGFARSASTVFPGDTDIQNSANSLITAVQNAVKYFKNSANRNASYGLTIYFPAILQTYITTYPTVTILDGQSFFSPTYTNMVSNYYAFYLAQLNNLVAIPSGLSFNGTDYTATVSNDFEEINALVGNNACTNVFNNDGVSLGVVPCYSTLQTAGITATPAGGNTWNISYNKIANINNWPLVNGIPALFITLDTEPVIPNEISFVVPVTTVVGNNRGYLSIIQNSDNQYSVFGFQSEVNSSNTQAKIVPIPNGTQFYLRTYALSGGSWGLFRTNIIITAPFTIGFGSVPGSFNAFRFLVSDLTGRLNITNTSATY